jgi:hypothetical protein
MKNSTLVFKLIAFISLILFALFNLYVTLFLIIALLVSIIVFYLIVCISETVRYTDDKYNLIKRKYNIVTIIINFLDSFPQIIKKK